MMLSLIHAAGSFLEGITLERLDQVSNSSA